MCSDEKMEVDVVTKDDEKMDVTKETPEEDEVTKAVSSEQYSVCERKFWDAFFADICPMSCWSWSKFDVFYSTKVDSDPAHAGIIFLWSGQEEPGFLMEVVK